MACGCAQRRVLAKQAMEQARRGNTQAARQSLGQIAQTFREDAAKVAARFGPSGPLVVKPGFPVRPYNRNGASR